MRAMTLRSFLLAISDTFGVLTNRSRSRVSTIVFRDGKVLDRIAAGGDLRSDRLETALSWFDENWPSGEARPRLPVPLPSSFCIPSAGPINHIQAQDGGPGAASGEGHSSPLPDAATIREETTA